MDEKILRKISRKVKRCEEILYKHEKLETSREETNALFIGNGGLGCGLQREYLVEVFKSFGPLENVVMLPGKPYAFVVFMEVQDAVTALTSLNGHNLKSGHIFYMSYINSADVPQVTMDRKAWPPGLVLIPNFVNEEEEECLLASISFEDVVEEKAVLKHRKVKHYGYEFIYGSNNVDKSKCLNDKIPQVCIPHLEKLVALGYISRIPDQLTVNYYLPGQGIPPHIDTHSAFEDGIVSLSLGSQVVMDFYSPEQETVPIVLPRRSVLVMLGESRYFWKHGITPRKTDVIPCSESSAGQLTLFERSPRTSLTFRLIRDGECNCEYKEQCDSQQKTPSIKGVLDNHEAEELEKKYVSQVYEKIADHFSNTRYKPWPKVASFLSGVRAGSFILDVGCGNGKNLKLSSNCFEIGCDASSNLIQVCSKRGVESLVADCLRLPFRDGSVDVVICIAVIHHMSTKDRRAKAVDEILRVLHRDGKALIYVWAFEQVGPEGQSKYLKGEEKCGSEENPTCEFEVSDTTCLPVHTNKKAFQQQDVLVPWKKSAQDVYHRFYHVFVKGELEALLSERGAKVLSSYYDDGNWCAVLTK